VGELERSVRSLNPSNIFRLSVLWAIVAIMSLVCLVLDLNVAQQLVEEYGTTWDIINSIPLQGGYQVSRSDSTKTERQLELNYQLMDLVYLL